jgi:hypothetical protein
MSLNSASMMWENVEAVFEGIRGVMRANGRARSGSFAMVWSAALQQFLEVIATCIIFHKHIEYWLSVVVNVCYSQIEFNTT